MHECRRVLKPLWRSALKARLLSSFFHLRFQSSYARNAKNALTSVCLKGTSLRVISDSLARWQRTLSSASSYAREKKNLRRRRRRSLLALCIKNFSPSLKIYFWGRDSYETPCLSRKIARVTRIPPSAPVTEAWTSAFHALRSGG